MALRMKKVFLNDQTQCRTFNEVFQGYHYTFLRRLWTSLVRLLSPLL